MRDQIIHSEGLDLWLGRILKWSGWYVGIRTGGAGDGVEEEEESLSPRYPALRHLW